MGQLKPLKWAIMLFHYYENKEYKERRSQASNKEYAIINMLSTVINDASLFSKKEIESVKNYISAFRISNVEKKAFQKIIETPYSKNIFIDNIKELDSASQHELFYSIADIFVSSSPASHAEKKFLEGLVDNLAFSNTTKNDLLSRLNNSYKELKKLFKENQAFIPRNIVCKDIILAEWDRISRESRKQADFFDTKEGIISTVILCSALANLELLVPDLLAVMWIPVILSRKDLAKASFCASEFVAIYKRYEKIVDWNSVNLSKLIGKYVTEGHLEPVFEKIMHSTLDFTGRILRHAFVNNEHRKISKFQRSLKY